MSSRQLSAIMFTDIVGYTLLMGKDRELALKVLEQNRKIHKLAINKYGGRLVKEIGDGILVCFLTASDAVYCAREIQQKLKDDSSYSLKIAIHLGEVEITEGDVFGDGVNIASRMEGITPAGTIYISDSVYKEIRNIPGIVANFQGETEFKNVDLPVKIYAVSGEGLTIPKRAFSSTATKGRSIPKWVIPLTSLSLILIWWFAYMNFDLIKSLIGNSTKVPTLAVLPFENLSGSDEDLHFCKGITEDILTQLSKIGDLKVINKSNLRKYDHQEKSYQEIGSELKVANLLLGSFRKIEDKVRVSARLIETATEEQLWAETFDGSIQDYFAIQTQVAVSIARALETTITASEAEKMHRPPTESFYAYDLYLKGKDFYSRYTIEDNLSALQLFYQAVDLDPNLALAYAGISDGYSQMAQKSNDQSLWLDSAFKYATIALQLDPELSDGHKSMGLYYTLSGNSRLAMDYYERAVHIDQNIDAIINLSRMYYRTGRLNQALQLLNNVQWYHPMEENIWFSLAATYYRLGDIDLARKSLDHALTTNPNHINSLLLNWKIAVLEGDKSMAFASANKLARIGRDNIDAILIEIASAIEGDDIDFSQRAQNLSSLLEGRENDYVEFEYIYNIFGYLYQKGGLPEKADSLFQFKMEYNMERILNGDESYKYPYEIAEIHSLIGNSDKSIEWLEVALSRGWMEYEYGIRDPLFGNIREDDRFRSIIGRTKVKLDSIHHYLEMNPLQDLELL